MEQPPGISFPVVFALMATDLLMMRYEWSKPAVES
jgi:hypothetical protein